MVRALRPAAAALALVLVASLLAVGCGGGGEETATKAAKTTKTSKAESKAKAKATEAETPEDLIDQVVTPTENTPEKVARSLEQRQPIVITFYIPGSSGQGPSDDSDVRSSITSLESKYKSRVDFYTYLYSDGERYGDLATLLQVNTTPTVIIINKEARVQRAWTGYVDSKTIEQGIVEAISS